jgi:hypothetical protein
MLGYGIVEVEVNLWPMVSWFRAPIWNPWPDFYFLTDKLQVSWCGAFSLTREWVYNLLVQLHLGLARAVILGSKSHRTHAHILLSHLRLPQLWGPGPRIYIPQEQSGPVIPPSTGFPFYRLLRLRAKVKVKVILRPTVCRPVRLGIRCPPGTHDQFFPFSLWFSFWQF